MQCQVGFEQPLGWYPVELKPCATENGPDGCPLGGVGSPGCSELGKVCSYPHCENPTTGSVLRYTCIAHDGGLAWLYEKIKCTE